MSPACRLAAWWVLAVALVPARAADGVGNHLCNPARTGYAVAAPAPPFRLSWVRAALHKPRPAWREPGWEPQRIDFDYAYATAAAGGLVYVASSTEHALLALDAATGRERWRVITEGPVRLAPEILGERLYVASDDGTLRCLDAAAGTEVWRYRPDAPDRRLLGNEQMISRRACRSGALADGDRVYATFGMLSPEGVFVVCLDAASGRVVWLNDTSGTRYTTRPHTTGMGGVSPQGYLALDGDVLAVTCGRAPPALFDRRTGELLYHEAEGDFTGGSWTMMTDGLVFSPCESLMKEYGSALQRAGDSPEAAPFPSASLIALNAKTGREVFSLQGGRRAVAAPDGTLILAGRDGLRCVRAEDVRAAVAAATTIKHTTGHFVDASAVQRWHTDCGVVYSMLRTDRAVISGGAGRILCHDVRDGKELWRAPVDGQVRELCTDGEQLFASTTEGRIYCFVPGNGAEGDTATVVPDIAPVPMGPDIRAEARRILEAAGMREGYALVTGVRDPGRLAALAAESDLSIVSVVPAEDAPGLRRELSAAGLYGARIAVHTVPPGALPYADYFANLAVVHVGSPAAAAPEALREVYRVLRPCGGAAVLVHPGVPAERIADGLRAAGIPASACSRFAGGTLVRRGPLEGAGEWTHQYADSGKSSASADRLIRLPLEALWYGGPGPAKMVSRHFRTPAPVVKDGRCFISGTDHLIALDIYNGRILWERELPELAHWPAAYRGPAVAVDERAVYALQKADCLLLDPKTGQSLASFAAPGEPGGEEIWEYVAVSGEILVGTVGRPHIKREWWSKAYPENTRLFALDRRTGTVRWTFTPSLPVDSNAIAVADGRVYLIEGRPPYEALRKPSAAAELPERVLRALDLDAGGSLWQTGDIAPTQNSLWVKDGVVLATVNPFSRPMEDPVVAQLGGGATAYSGKDGRRIWHVADLGSCSPVLTDGIAYLPDAYELATGRPVRVSDPLTGEPKHFRPGMPKACSTYSGCPTLLMSRSGSMGFYDLAQREGVYYYPILRASCWINMIPAGGVITVPEGSSSCVCGYNYKTSIALVPRDRQYHYGVARVPSPPAIRTLRLNFGAPGDRPDLAGDLWFAYPRPTAYGRPLAKAGYGPKIGGGKLPIANLNGKGDPPVYAVNPDFVPADGPGMPWLYACGLKAPAKLAVRVAEGAEAVPCRVRLYAAVPPGADPKGGWAVRIRGEEVRFSPGPGVSGAVRGLAPVEITVSVPGELQLELVPNDSGGGWLAGVEILRP